MTLFANSSLAYGHRAGSITWLITDWVSYYGILIFLGMLASILTIVYFWRRQKYPMEILITLIIITIPSAIFGARLWFIFEEISGGSTTVAENWWKINEGGLSIQGGVVVPTIFNLIYITRKKDVIDYRQAISFILPAVLIGQAIGRWGNYMNHELYGFEDPAGVWSKWLGPVISGNMFIFDTGDPVYRVPLFFYESMTSLFGYIMIVWVFNFFGWFKPGVTGGMYLVYYGIVRSSMEYLRHESFLLYLIMSIIFILFGLTMIIYFQFLGDRIWVMERIGKIKTIRLLKNSKPGKNWFMKKFQKIEWKFSKFKIKTQSHTRYHLEKYKIWNLNIHSYVKI